MAESSFWDNPEKARETIALVKPLNGLLNPYEALASGVEDLLALAELTDEDSSLEGEMAKELSAVEKRLAEFELQAMLAGPQDASNAFVRIQAGTGGTEACDWAQMLLRLYTR